ncbi:Bet v1-like protein [Meredithblackwellia eburnea MCA 4105]
MSVAQPDPQAVPNYPTEGHKAEIDTAHALFLEELSSTEGWEDQGEREGGVQLYKKDDPENPYGVPTVKGEVIVPNCTSDAFLAVIQLPGMRTRWDPRFQGGHMLARYSRLSFAFYTEMKGMGWLVYPRDIVGVQQNFKSKEFNQEITVIQTSVQEDELAPEQSGKTRATLSVSGWQLLPQGDDLKVTYIVKISLNGSMPLAMVSMVATETPLCTGRAKDVYESLGHAPYVHILTTDNEDGLTFQNESITPPVSATDGGPLEYRSTFGPAKAGTSFHVVYDAKKLYAGGVEVVLEGDAAGKDGVQVSDDGEGKISVKVEKELGGVVALVVKPK